MICVMIQRQSITVVFIFIIYCFGAADGRTDCARDWSMDNQHKTAVSSGQQYSHVPGGDGHSRCNFDAFHVCNWNYWWSERQTFASQICKFITNNSQVVCTVQLWGGRVQISNNLFIK